MKRCVLVLIICFTSSLAFAEYKDLTALKQYSLGAVKTYGAHLTKVDTKFEGVIDFGKSLKRIGQKKKFDISKRTYRSKYYWRAVLEMDPRDPSILFAHGYLHALRGETAYADMYFLLGSVTMDESHRAELSGYDQLREKLEMRVKKELGTGIAHHDKGEYEKALQVYDRVIAEHPNGAWAYYEKGFSYMLMGKDRKSYEKKMEKMFKACRERDPFFWQAYQGSDQKVIGKLKVLLEKIQPFLTGKKRTVEGIAAFAEGCEAMELYPFAAHARWKLVLLDSDNAQLHIRTFLSLLEKCGCEDVSFFRRQFKLSKGKGLTKSTSQHKGQHFFSPNHSKPIFTASVFIQE